jgi:hypothetical protein
VQHAPKSIRKAGPEPFRVQSVIENVHDLHAALVMLQICGGLAFDEGHNIAKCASCRA